MKIYEIAETTTDTKLQKKLAKNNNFVIKKCLAANPNLGCSIQRKLAKDKNIYLLRTLGGNKNLLKELQINFSSNPDLHCVIVNRNDLCIASQQNLLSGDDFTKRSLVVNSCIKFEIFEQLFLIYYDLIFYMINNFNYRYQDARIIQKIEKLKLLI